MKQYINNAENKGRKRRMGEVDLSPKVIVWKKRRDVWNSLIRLHKGAQLNLETIKPGAKV